MKAFFNKNFVKVFNLSLFMLVGAALVSSCSDSKFKVNGEIEGGEGKSMLLEKSDFHGRWIPLDSVKVSSSGEFSLEADAPASPEIYRLSLDDRFIYFPVDSIEKLTVRSSVAGFGRDFSVTGTLQAERLAEFEKELMTLDINDSVKATAFKRNVYNKYLKDAKGSIISYYVLTKIVGNKPLYDPASKEDAKYYAAVATSFQEFKPSDPHTQMLRQVSLDAMQRKNNAEGKKVVLEANELTLIDVELPDENGKMVKLSDVAKQGKPTVVVFGMMNQPESPAFNVALSELYSRLGGRVNFYHISLDADQYVWRDAARNLPWITVFDQSGQTSDALVKYNVTSLPAFYIYNAAGSLVDRGENLRDLEKKLASY